jgi:hypothetical protein
MTTKASSLSVQTNTGLTGVVHRSDRCSMASSTTYHVLPPSRNRPHNRLGLGHLHTRLKYTIRGVVPILVSPLLYHCLLTLTLEAKLVLVTISPTIPTMELHGSWLGLRLGWGCSLGFLTSLSSLGFTPSFPKNTLPMSLLNLIGFWKSFVE